MKTRYRRFVPLFGLAVSAAASTHATLLHAQAQPQHRFSLTVAPTVLPFSTLSGSTVPAALVSGGVEVFSSGRWTAAVAARAIAPLEGTSVAADCVPNVPCPTYQSPDALYSATAQVGWNTLGRKLRASLGVGFLSAQNLSEHRPTNSPAIELGVEYAILPARKVSPLITVHVQRLTRDVGGLTTLVLPGFGIRF